MSRRRWFILLVGPLPIVAASLLLAWGMRSGQENQPLAANQVLSTSAQAAEPLESGEAETTEPSRPEPVAKQTARAPRERLAARCRATAEELRKRLGDDCALVVRSPFVIAGDLSEDALADWHERTIAPAARCMAAAYFRKAPDQPVTVLLFASEEGYTRYARELFGDEGISVYGYYKPQVRTLVMNVGTGGGTLVHELTHALVAFDFPEVPDWFNEGLASLHEQCRFRRDESGIDGLVNWRLPALQTAARAGRLRSLESLIGDDDFRQGDMGMNYAQARYFCMYLQHHGKLEGFYAALRGGAARDRLGLTAARAACDDQPWSEIDAAFQEWVLALEYEPR